MSEEQKYHDERLEQALDKSRYKYTLTLQRQNCNLKYKQALAFAENGGTFHITESLISFVGTLIQRNQEEAILIDINNNPILIENLESFIDKIIDRYYQATNEYLLEYKKIRSARSVSPALEW